MNCGKVVVIVALVVLMVNMGQSSAGEGRGLNIEDRMYLDRDNRISPDLESMLDEEEGGGDIGLIVQLEGGVSTEDKDYLRTLGFSVQRTFHAVPALSIRGPGNALDRVFSWRRATYVEHNDPVVLDMEMGTWVINATKVWSNLIKTGGEELGPIDGSGVTVCVVDTGIDSGHPDLDYGRKTVMNVFDAGGGVWIEAENTDTNYGHGTHVAGTVAGNGDASAGARRGVAPGANLIGVTVSIPEEAATPTEDGYIQGLEWVFDHSQPGANPHNIRCVTNSWHSTVEEYDPDSLLTQMIEKLTFENNVVSTWSAGNDGRDDPDGTKITTSGQGNTPVAIMVAAYERDGSAVTDFSSRGQVGLNHTYPDIGAPGRNIWSTSARRTVISGASYVGGNRNPYYLAISGTSMSTPHVAGLTALLWQAAPSLKISELHEDYSGDDKEWWYGNPNTRIHEVEWILEASAHFLPPTTESGNTAGDSDSSGWDGRPVDYVQGYGLVDAQKAVGLALTLQRLREKYPDKGVTVRDAIESYNRDGVKGKGSMSVARVKAEWGGEYSRYNDQSGNPLSLVNQTKYVPVPEGAKKAKISMSYTPVSVEEFKFADLAFAVDQNGDGTVDYQSELAPNSQGIDEVELEVGDGGQWTFDIMGMGVKIPRPLQGINYVELRIEYEISVTFTLDGNGSTPLRQGDAYNAPLFPGEGGKGGGSQLEIGLYDLRSVEIEAPEPVKTKPEEPFPYWIPVLVVVIALGAALYLKRKRGF